MSSDETIVLDLVPRPSLRIQVLPKESKVNYSFKIEIKDGGSRKRVSSWCPYEAEVQLMGVKHKVNHNKWQQQRQRRQYQQRPLKGGAARCNAAVTSPTPKAPVLPLLLPL
ncbi:hypothetical protein RUM43_000033 [Polyplax serrata]|uniref:Uncharacterized protein n=1 Tax=Polyplax serrata TaxID=468196 RepID=A0AAN8SBV3_POLSC